MFRRVAALFVCLTSAAAASGQMPPDQFVVSNGVKIRYVEQGTGEPVLLIHGYTRSVESNWVDPGVFQDLAKNYRVIAFDLRGHGKSDKPHDPAAYAGETVRDAIRLLDHLRIPRAHVVGYSLGAIIVAKLVTTDPDRFVTATLGGHAGYRNWLPQFDESAKRYADELEGDVPFRGVIIGTWPTDEPRPTEDVIRERSTVLAAVNDVKALAAFQRGGSRELNATDAEISAVKVPMLGVIGSADNTRGMAQLKGLLPSLTVVTIEGATHAGERSAVRRPEFVRAVRDFIAAHRLPL